MYAVLLGALSTVIVSAAEGFALMKSGLQFFVGTVGLYGFLSMLLVGLVEEGSKFLLLRFTFFRSKFFNEVSDGIIYGVAIGLGFAFVENVFYSMALGAEVSLIRALSTPIFHASAAGLSGYFLARSTFNHRSLGYLGLFLAILIHGLSNYLLVLTTAFKSLPYLFLVATLDLTLVIWILVLFQYSAKKKPLRRTRKLKTHPVVAAFLNIVPGMGLLYLNRWSLGFLMISTAVLLYLLGQFSFFFGFIFWPLVVLVSLFIIIFLIFFSGIITYLLAKNPRLATQQK